MCLKTVTSTHKEKRMVRKLDFVPKMRFKDRRGFTVSMTGQKKKKEDKTSFFIL